MRGLHISVLLAVVVLCLTAVSCGATADVMSSLQLPRSLYKSIAGGWNVDLYSPCGTHASGVVSFANETAIVRWADQDAELVITPFEDSKAMVMTGIHPFMTRQASDAAVSYRICERLENSMDTPRRPGLGSAMRATHLYDFEGVFESSGADPCEATARPIHIRAMGNPLVTSLFTSDQKAQVQYMEITADTRMLAETCSTGRTEDPAAPLRDGTGGRGRRKRNTARQVGRSTTSASASSDTAVDASVPGGLLVMRFAMSTPPPKSTFQRLSPIVMFVCMFAVMRIVYGYSSAKAAKS